MVLRRTHVHLHLQRYLRGYGRVWVTLDQGIDGNLHSHLHMVPSHGQSRYLCRGNWWLVLGHRGLLLLLLVWHHSSFRDNRMISSGIVLKAVARCMGLPQVIPMSGHGEHNFWVYSTPSSSFFYGKTSLLQHEIALLLALKDCPRNLVWIESMGMTEAGKG